MQFRAYPLKRNGLAHIALMWQPGWQHVQVSVEGHTLQPINDRETLRAGVFYQMRDGHQLIVRLRGYKIDVRVDDRPLPGTPFDPYNRLKLARWILVCFAVIDIISGLRIWLFYQLNLASIIVLVPIIQGIIFALIANKLWEDAPSALWAGIVLYIIDIVISLFVISSQLITVTTSIIPEHLVLLFFLFLGFQGINIVKDEEREWPYESAKPLDPIQIGQGSRLEAFIGLNGFRGSAIHMNCGCYPIFRSSTAQTLAEVLSG